MAIPQPIDAPIRTAAEVDADAISVLVTDLSQKYITFEYSSEGAETLLNHQTPAAIRDVMRQGTRYWVATGTNGIVGVVAVTASSTHLYHLFVAESHQHQGLGRRLWEHAYRECVCEDHPGEFTVNSSLHAVPFYRSLGFSESGPLNDRNGVICQPMRLKIH